MVQEALTVCMCFCLLVTEICLTVTASPPGKTQVGGPQTHGSRFSFLGVPHNSWLLVLSYSLSVELFKTVFEYRTCPQNITMEEFCWNLDRELGTGELTIYISTTCSIWKSTKIRLTIRKKKSISEMDQFCFKRETNYSQWWIPTWFWLALN